MFVKLHPRVHPDDELKYAHGSDYIRGFLTNNSTVLFKYEQ